MACRAACLYTWMRYCAACRAAYPASSRLRSRPTSASRTPPTAPPLYSAHQTVPRGSYEIFFSRLVSPRMSFIFRIYCTVSRPCPLLKILIAGKCVLFLNIKTLSLRNRNPDIAVQLNPYLHSASSAICKCIPLHFRCCVHGNLNSFHPKNCKQKKKLHKSLLLLLFFILSRA